MKKIWHLHRDKKTHKLVTAKRGEGKTIIYKYVDKKISLGEIITDVDRFYDFFESVNMSKKCQCCGKYSGYNWDCKDCKIKRDQELKEIASEVINGVVN